MCILKDVVFGFNIALSMDFNFHDTRENEVGKNQCYSYQLRQHHFGTSFLGVLALGL